MAVPFRASSGLMVLTTNHTRATVPDYEDAVYHPAMTALTDHDRDTLMRMAAFEHVRGLSEVYDHLTANELRPGFVFDGERIPLVNPQRGILLPAHLPERSVPEGTSAALSAYDGSANAEELSRVLVGALSGLSPHRQKDEGYPRVLPRWRDEARL